MLIFSLILASMGMGVWETRDRWKEGTLSSWPSVILTCFQDFFFFLAVLGLRFCARAFSSCGKQGPLFIVVRGPLTIAASLIAEHRLQMRRLSSCGSRA